MVIASPATVLTNMRDAKPSVAAIATDGLAMGASRLLPVVTRAAEAAGVPLDDGLEARIAVGGVITRAITVPVDLQVMDANWHAGVSFCDPWPFGFGLLGQEGFFRFFETTFRASQYSFELQPDAGPPYP